MPRHAKPGEKRTEKMTATAPPSVKAKISEMMGEHDRTESWIMLAMLTRGLAAYERDGLLQEPNKSNGQTAEKRFVKEITPGREIPRRTRKKG